MAEMMTAPKTLLLECIAGKDHLRKLPVGPQPVVMADASMHPQIVVKEIAAGQGFLTFYANNGLLIFDAHNCQLPVFLNNVEVKQGSLQQHDLLRIGDSIWRAQQGVATGKTPAGLREQFNSLLGLEELKDFKLGSIFSEVYKKHTTEEMEEQLITGTARHTPALSEIEVGWAKPWLFARLLGISAILAFGLYIGLNTFENIILIPGLIFVGSFAVPLSALLFFLEMNAPRNVSIFIMLKLLFIGGVVSILLALVFFQHFNIFKSFLGSSAAGIIEESAKLLIVIWLMGRSARYKWTLNGLLFGAAVGTGFAAFESAGYAFAIMLNDGMDAGISNITLRGLLSPFGHIVWTANASAALWLVKKDRPFTWDMLQANSFVRIFISVMLLHMIWNAPFSLIPMPFIADVKYLVLGVLAWLICFRLVQAGLRQLSDARQAEVRAQEQAVQEQASIQPQVS